MMLSNSEAASKSLCFVHDSEPVQESGVYIGKTNIYKRPFFLETGDLLNPHIIAVGMTGSGKTYFLKSYIIRSRLVKEASVFIIDWNGEYDEVVEFLDGTVARPAVGEDGVVLVPELIPLLDGAHSVSLAGLADDAKRKRSAISIMEHLIETMHSMPISVQKTRIVLLDEAWKMLGDSKSLGQLFREGRKYGFNVVVATQLVKDVNNEMLANSGCALIFRLQNDDDYSTLVDTGIISAEQKDQLPSLAIGNCFVHLAHKSGGIAAETFFIKKIDGFQTSVYTIKGDNMQFIKISSEQFHRVTEKFLPAGVRAGIVNYVEANDRSVDLIGVLRFLVKCGVKRRDVVVYLRVFGISDIEIAKAYEEMESGIR